MDDTCRKIFLKRFRRQISPPTREKIMYY